MSINGNLLLKLKFFDATEFSFINFDFKNEWKNILKDSCKNLEADPKKGFSQNRSYAVLPRNGHADSVGLNVLSDCRTLALSIF